MNYSVYRHARVWFLICLLSLVSIGTVSAKKNTVERPRLIATTDGEIDDECSLVRFLLYTNDWDVEAIVFSSSQYHWEGHNWPGYQWADKYFDAYEEVYPQLLEHDSNYPTPDYLRSHYYVGNVKAEAEMEEITPGSQRIVEVLLDESDPRPVWLQAWGGTNTIARALKTIEEEHPERMEEVAAKMRFFFIWEQDSTYQSYIRPHWGKYQILTIISDQFEAIAYRWRKFLPQELFPYFESEWTQNSIVQNHGPLCSLYKCRENGEFRSEGDSPSYMHEIVTGLRNMDHPDWGGWGGRYVKVRENTWLDENFSTEYQYPEGRYYASNSRSPMLRGKNPDPKEIELYFRPMAMWIPAFQNDFAARADWCVRSYKEANHQPVVRVKIKGGKADSEEPLNLTVKAGEELKLNAARSKDPDKDALNIRFWQYAEAGTCRETLSIEPKNGGKKALVTVPANLKAGETLHIICEVSDNGEPVLTRYQRIVLTGE